MAAGESTMPLVLVNQPIVGLLFKRTGFYSDLVYYLNEGVTPKGFTRSNALSGMKFPGRLAFTGKEFIGNREVGSVTDHAALFLCF
jgi:hypothetical protein